MRWSVARSGAAAFLAGLVMSAAAHAEGEVAGRMRLMARSLTADYLVKRPGADRAPLAVFDFACSPKLAEQRVGYAVAELLKPTLISVTAFTLLERSELDKIFKEQALQQTGTVDEHTAVALGKIVGAKLAIFGSVDKVGPAYQVSARLADVANGEVLAVSVQELPAKDFETEAQSYLNLVPEEEAIGLFLGVGDGFAHGFANKGPVPVGSGATGGVETVTEETGKPPAAELGLGVRYQPARWLLIQGTFAPFVYDVHVRVNLTANQPAPSGMDTPTARGDFPALGMDLAAFWVHPLAPRFRLLAGPGLAGQFFQQVSGNGGNSGGLATSVATTTPGNSVSAIATIEGNDQQFFRPFLEAGVEWKLQTRLGWTLAARYYPLAQGPDINVLLPGTPGTPGHGADQGVLATVTMAQLILRTSFALYF